ncbi:porin [Singulisphaera sp. GP187]|uniref:porin n=1 Tax=Singulisphaera sp. GP187 TaxID=1882752 RepID=UPI000940CA0D|nr:porin [Singulisphaera sp. GP187]
MDTSPVARERSPVRSELPIVRTFCLLLGLALAAVGQEPPPSSVPTAPAAAAEVGAPSNAELAEQLRLLRSEVAETRALKAEVQQLRGIVQSMGVQPGPGPGGATSPAVRGGSGPAPAASTGLGGVREGTASESQGVSNGVPERFHSGAFTSRDDPGASTERFGIKGRYKYNDKATGPLGGGGYFSFSSPDDEFSLNVTNQITVDGTFIDRARLQTTEQGFNVPFARSFIYGNITKDWSYQVGVQGFLGTFNLLDLFLAWHINDYVTLRAGKGLAPPLYEYYAFSPALEPVITNSPLYQLAAKRPLGLMFTGNLWKNRIQWWSGISNSGTSLFGNLDRNQDYNGAVDFTPFRGEGWEETVLEGLGGGVGFSGGKQEYLLNQQGVSISNNGEATTNPAFSTVLGIPFSTFHSNVSANGMRSVFSPHVYWYGRLSLLAEYINFSRALTDGTTSGRSTQRGYYVNASYWLTGERDFMGNGFQGYSTVTPLHPFIPSKHMYGPGAWQIAAQWSELNAGTGDVARGFVDTSRSTNRMNNFMVGLNWWPNQYTRLSFDYVTTNFNNPIPLSGRSPVDGYQTFWMRFAMFF